MSPFSHPETFQEQELHRLRCYSHERFARAVQDHEGPMMKRKDIPEGGLIHLVDHDATSLLFLFEELTRAGYQVNASSGSRKALDFIRERKPEIVLCNLHMPEIDGLEVLAEVKR